MRIIQIYSCEIRRSRPQVCELKALLNISSHSNLVKLCAPGSHHADRVGSHAAWDMRQALRALPHAELAVPWSAWHSVHIVRVHSRERPVGQK